MTTADRPKKPGRPITRKVKIDDTAEEIARSIFRAANPPRPQQAPDQAAALLISRTLFVLST